MKSFEQSDFRDQYIIVNMLCLKVPLDFMDILSLKTKGVNRILVHL